MTTRRYLEHPIVTQSFALIDQEVGTHGLTPAAYQVLRRIIHSTADFEYRTLLEIGTGAIAAATTALQQGQPIVTDVGMVARGIQTVVAQTFANPVIVAVEQVKIALPGQTRTESGLLACCKTYPEAVYVIGNAPTALLALCQQMTAGQVHPSCVVGVPVGFVNVIEAKAALAECPVPQIRVAGRKGGSVVAAAIVNALQILAWEQDSR